MSVYYLDTNIFLNVIYKEKNFYEKSRKFLEEINNGKYQAVTSSITLLEIALDMAESGYIELVDKAIASIEDIKNLEIVSLNKTMTKQAAIFVLRDNISIHDAYHLSTALQQKVKAFITRDEELQKKINRYIKTITPEEV
ncbi:MAG: type II toxin-antitoxin system VapC family toxin [Nitrososphaerota archaeon]